ncbi:MAG: hypothetical protein C0467_09825 [Planctomycetaceae bacterium]|nr:hypothetical protein [Planctomycetaceae bacterium]
MHTIRLRGAWANTTTESTVRHSRNFGWLATLDPGDQLWLICTQIPGPCQVILNEVVVVTVPEAGPFAHEITGDVHTRNMVTFVVASPEPLGEVTLEVRSPLE